jgi:hypothetical protein
MGLSLAATLLLMCRRGQHRPGVLAIPATVFSPVINSILFLLLPLYYLEWTE